MPANPPDRAASPEENRRSPRSRSRLLLAIEALVLAGWVYAAIAPLFVSGDTDADDALRPLLPAVAAVVAHRFTAE